MIYPFLVVTILLFAPLFLVSGVLLCRVGAVALITSLWKIEKFPKLELPQILFLIWLAWAAVGCLLSDHRQTAIEGFWLRNEGLITWITITAAAWTCRDMDEKHLSYFAIFLCFLFVLLGIGKRVFFWDIRFQAFIIEDVALASFASLGLVLAYSILHPATCILIAPIFLITSNRTSFFAVLAGLAFYHWYGQKRFRISLKAFCLGLCVFLALIPLTPLYAKLASSNASLRGSRSQWIAQADKLGKSMPLFGHGLDTQSKYLNRARGETQHKRAIADRVHFLPLDIVLQAGWLGYTILLLSIGSAIGYAIKYGGDNMAYAAVIVTWCAFGLINPQGIHAMFLMLFCLFRIKKPTETAIYTKAISI